MDLFETIFWGNELYRWLLAMIIILVMLLLAQIIHSVVDRRVAMQASGSGAGNGLTGGALLSLLTAITSRTRGYFILVTAVYLGALFLILPVELSTVLRTAAITVLLLQVGFWGSSFITFWVTRRVRQELERDNTNATTLGGLGLVARIIFWSIIILLILENITGMEINTLVASLGVTGVAVALAVQNILSDLFASLSITLDRPFVIGDSIVVGEFSGQVEHIGLKSTRIRSLTGEQLIFSNSDLLNSRIRNYKRMDRRRVSFLILVTYSTTPDQIERIPRMLEQIIVTQPEVTFDRAHFKEFRETALAFEVVYYIENPDYMLYMDTQQVINLQIMRRFAVENIEFAVTAPSFFRNALQGDGKPKE